MHYISLQESLLQFSPLLPWIIKAASVHLYLMDSAVVCCLLHIGLITDKNTVYSENSKSKSRISNQDLFSKVQQINLESVNTQEDCPTLLQHEIWILLDWKYIIEKKKRVTETNWCKSKDINVIHIDCVHLQCHREIFLHLRLFCLFFFFSVYFFLPFLLKSSFFTSFKKGQCYVCAISNSFYGKKP